MIKQLAILSILTAIHYSSLGDYLVDQDGHKVVIQGHPEMICHQGIGDIEGTFVEQHGDKIVLKNASRFVLIKYPVCDIIKKGEK